MALNDLAYLGVFGDFIRFETAQVVYLITKRLFSLSTCNIFFCCLMGVISFVHNFERAIV
jgi:hypothetical protein